MKAKILVLFSNPEGFSRLRLDKEDRLLAGLARRFPDEVVIDRQHASEVEDIHSLLISADFDIIHFSGHGNPSGICLEKVNCATGELVSPKTLVNLLALPERAPSVVLLLCCYSDAHVSLLADAAPFVVTASDTISDQACLSFTEGFYECFLRNRSVQSSFEYALNLMESRGLPTDSMKLARRHFVRRSGSLFVESRPSPNHDSILINLDQVRDKLAFLGLAEEQFSYDLAKRLKIHFWIFDTPRERALIPVGHLLFGEFSWENARDIVRCTAIRKLRSDAPRDLWKLWASLLSSYNDLAACEYRRPGVHPADPANKHLLKDAVLLYQNNITKYLRPAESAFPGVSRTHLSPHVVIAISHSNRAADQLNAGRLQQTVHELELALTNYHEVVSGLQPPEE